MSLPSTSEPERGSVPEIGDTLAVMKSTNLIFVEPTQENRNETRKTTIASLRLCALFASCPLWRQQKQLLQHQQTNIEVPVASANPELMFGDYQAVGFLTDYSGDLEDKKNLDGYPTSIEASTTVDCGKYNKLLVDIRIRILFHGRQRLVRGSIPDELKGVDKTTFWAIPKQVGDAYPMVTEPDRARAAPAWRLLIWCRINPQGCLLQHWSFLSCRLPDADGGVATGGNRQYCVQRPRQYRSRETLDSDSSEQLSGRLHRNANRQEIQLDIRRCEGRKEQP